MDNKVLIFDNPEDFLKVIDELQKAYNEKLENESKLTGVGNNE